MIYGFSYPDHPFRLTPDHGMGGEDEEIRAHLHV